MRHDPVDAHIVLDLAGPVLGVDGADAAHLAPVDVELDKMKCRVVHLSAAVVAGSGSARSLNVKLEGAWPTTLGELAAVFRESLRAMTSSMPSGDARGVRSRARHTSGGESDGGQRWGKLALRAGFSVHIADTYATLRPALACLAASAAAVPIGSTRWLPCICCWREEWCWRSAACR